MFGLFLVMLSLQSAFMPEYSLRRGAVLVWTIMSWLSGNSGGVVLGVQNPLDNVSSPSTSGSSEAVKVLLITIAGGSLFMGEVSKRLS